ncbi:MAG: M48 family metalloprotease [Burkholderiales bacterium]
MELNDSQSGYWRKFQISMGTRLSESLRDEVSKRPLTEADSDSATASPGVKLAYVVATLIYSSSVAMGVAGIALVAMSGGKIIYLLGGGLCLLVAALSLPRFARAPEKIVSREDYPGIYALTDRVAETLETEPVSGVGVSAEFNANYRIAGWKGQRYVEIGAALAAVLSVEEFVALVAHEMSHGANGDPLRGRYLGGALNTVVRWGGVIRPTTVTGLGEGMPYGPIVSILGIPFAIVALLLSEAIFLVAKGFYLLVLRQSQRAEYLADVLASKIAGAHAMSSQLEKLYLFDVVDTAIQRHALTNAEAPIQDALREAVRSLPDSKLDSLRAESRAQGWRVDSTHPPTAMRTDVIKACGNVEPAMILSEEERRGIAIELTRLVESMRNAMTGSKIEAMYF